MDLIQELMGIICEKEEKIRDMIRIGDIGIDKLIIKHTKDIKMAKDCYTPNGNIEHDRIIVTMNNMIMQVIKLSVLLIKCNGIEEKDNFIPTSVTISNMAFMDMLINLYGVRDAIYEIAKADENKKFTGTGKKVTNKNICQIDSNAYKIQKVVLNIENGSWADAESIVNMIRMECSGMLDLMNGNSKKASPLYQTYIMMKHTGSIEYLFYSCKNREFTKRNRDLFNQLGAFFKAKPIGKIDDPPLSNQEIHNCMARIAQVIYTEITKEYTNIQK